MRFDRYALYFTPQPGPLAAFGAAWLGWDSATGRSVAHPALPGLAVPDLALPVARVTERPRRYGLHATLKPPFRLAEGQSEAALAAAVASFCARRPPVAAGPLVIAPLGRFLALVPATAPAGPGALAAATVSAFDRFRAPPTAAELARHRGTGLGSRNEARLRRWGHPHVMEGFRFHITLTGRLPGAELARLQTALAAHLDPLLSDVLQIDALSLMGEDAQGFFHVIARHRLTG